jgi:hypothetical protein
MKSIDAEIFEVERRLHRREAAIKHDARALKQRSVRALMSPVSIVGAVALGFLVAGGVARRKAQAPLRYRDRRKQSAEKSKKGLAAGGLLMTAATWFIRNQFGGPVGLSQFVLSKIRQRENRGQSPGSKIGVRPQAVKTGG